MVKVIFDFSGNKTKICFCLHKNVYLGKSKYLWRFALRKNNKFNRKKMKIFLIFLLNFVFSDEGCAHNWSAARNKDSLLKKIYKKKVKLKNQKLTIDRNSIWSAEKVFKTTWWPEASSRCGKIMPSDWWYNFCAERCTRNSRALSFITNQSSNV